MLTSATIIATISLFSGSVICGNNSPSTQAPVAITTFVTVAPTTTSTTTTATPTATSLNPPQQTSITYACLNSGAQTFNDPSTGRSAQINFINGVDTVTTGQKCNIEYSAQCNNQCFVSSPLSQTYNCYNAWTGNLLTQSNGMPYQITITSNFTNANAAASCNANQAAICPNNGCTA